MAVDNGFKTAKINVRRVAGTANFEAVGGKVAQAGIVKETSMADIPKSSPILRFNPALPKKDLEKIRDNVSAIAIDGEHLWLGGDEGTSIHRMTRDASANFGNHTSFDLHGTLGLPGPSDQEIDIEGLDMDGGYLWLIGSHSAKRKKADKDETTEKNLKRLAKIEMEGNRFTLARVPLDASATPVSAHGGLTAARLHGTKKDNLLTKALMNDDHVGRFVPREAPAQVIEGIPSKDNGFDVEGLAVKGNRVFLGLRGPVLRGWATVIELQVSAGGGELTLDTFASSGKTYLKHFLQLDGLGVRELVIDGNDVLVLAGPSMDLDGPVFIYRWKEALNSHADSLTWNKDLMRVVTVPFGVTKDHAEGLTVVTTAPLSLMVCYDSPAATRIEGPDGSGVKADVFEISG
jgi:Protein of unknown function (DUF3616)